MIFFNNDMIGKRSGGTVTNRDKQSDQQYIELQDALNELDSKVAEEQYKNAPKCHLTTMMMMRGDGEYYNDQWWECSHCGHVKEIF